MDYTYTVALSTRLKRKFFDGESGVEQYVSALIKLFCADHGYHLLLTQYVPYGVIIVIQGEAMDPPSFFSSFRRNTSGKIRDMFPKMQAIPSFWHKQIYWKEGKLDAETEEEISAYFANIRTR